MTVVMIGSPLQAMIRFGLGRRGDEPVPADPAAWLRAQLDGPDPALAAPISSTLAGLEAHRQDREMKRMEGQPSRVQELWKADLHVAMRTLAETAHPFRERLVWLWANHFTVSIRKNEVRPLALPYVWEAIRPHVTGRFVDMLRAVVRHPAMLWYLDNQESAGPDSPVGQKTHRGLNENLARECLELHTIGAGAGYTQADVTAFAAVLTGWSVDMGAATPGFAFMPQRHQPGPKTIMGMSFPEGEAGGEAVLTWLGHHPATFHRLAERLVRHFVADSPAPADVRRIADVLHRTEGSLKAATLALLDLPAAWTPLTKLRTPADYVVAATRALDQPEDKRPDMHGLMAQFGQPFLSAPLPNGWPDTAADWADGEMLLRRADWAVGVAGRHPALDPMALADNSLGDLLGETSRQAIERAASRRDAVALALAAPEFQRR
jgi:uncharacterized protein (DUF1800 family)